MRNPLIPKIPLDWWLNAYKAGLLPSKLCALALEPIYFGYLK
jgi:hypothetical protein